MDERWDVEVSAETLTLPVFKVNLVGVLGRVPTLKGGVAKVSIYPGKFIEETSQMLRFLYPDVRVAFDPVRMEEMDEA